MYLSKVTINLILTEHKIEFKNNNSDQLQEIIKNFIGNNQEEILATVKPALERAVSGTIISISNNIVKHFTYDQLFPDRT